MIKRSLALKVIMLVGIAITLMFVLQAYLNISNFQKLVNPLIIKNLDSALLRSKIVFDNIYKQTLEDAQIVRAHNSLSNYLDYEQIDDQQGLNDELVELEQFLIALTDSKPRYHDIEVITLKGSIIRLVDGLVVESQKNQSAEFMANSVPVDKLVYFSSHDSLDGHPVNTTLLNLNYQFSAENEFIDGQGTSVVIRVSNDISQPIEELSLSLKSSDMALSVSFQGQLVAGTKDFSEVSSVLWLTKHIQDDKTGLDIAVSIRKADAFLIIDEVQRSIIVLALSLFLVVGLSQLVTIRILIANPLKNIIRFIKDHALQNEHVVTHYKTNSKDEIGVFADGLNKMLDKIQDRQSALKDSEERLALALWGSGEGLWEYTVDDGMMYLDKMSCSILGLPNEELKTCLNLFSETIHVDDKDVVEHYFSDFSELSTELFEIEFRVAKQQGYIWLQLRGKLTGETDISGNKHTLVGTFRNITEQRESEEKIRLYAKAFDSSGSAILILDRTLIILAANDAFSQITGHKLSDVVGRVPDFIVNSHQSTFSISDFTRQIETNGQWQSELIGVKSDNSRFVKDISINAIFDLSRSPSHYVCSFSDITQKKKSEEDLWNMANHDILTNLPNRGYFRKTLDLALRDAAQADEDLALLFIDLDRFKQVNDTLGHETGDELLKKVASILSKVARKNDYAARLGGDEFAIILAGVSGKENIEKIVTKLVKNFSDGLYVNGKDTGVGLSVGISTFPTDTTSADDLVHFADTAMYFSKTNGTNEYHFFDPSMSDHVNRRNLIEKELRIALQADTLNLYYQPQIDIVSGKIVCFEALSRWFHPDLGTIFPDEFIPIAEDSGLIVQLGQRALVAACKQLKEWHLLGFSELKMAINVSPKQFLLSDVAFDVTNVLDEIELEAKYIELELTESLIVDDPEKIIGMLNKLKTIGVNLSIDDFGTGYSSLSYLNRFPLDVLKIDKSFINQLTTDTKGLAITKAIIAIAHTLRLEVIAEGVENERQLDILLELGCKYVQGYYFGKPVSANDTLAFLKEHNQFDL